MKRITLIFVFSISQLIIFAQQKHITYSKQTTVNTSNYLDYFKVASSTNFDGYFLASKYDDGSFLMKHYVTKIDFKGDVVWDTVYRFDEPFSASVTGISSIVSTNNDLTIATPATGTNSNSKWQPFIYNIDNYGNILWNKYYEIDTLEYTTNLIQSNDGGYVLFGGAFDYSGIGMSGKYAYAYKIDPSGTLEWSKFYSDKDTAEFVFQAGATTMDDKYIFAGDADNENFGGAKAPSPESYDNFMNVVCVDVFGDVLWNSALFFDVPVSNSNFQVKSVNVIDAQTVLVSFQYYNIVTAYDDYGLASINITDGVVNWVKGYSLQTESTNINLRKVVKKNDGNLVVFYDDYSSNAKSDLLELDFNGNIIQNKTIQEFVASNTFFHDVIASEDGGLFIAANLFSGTGVLTFKTDKNINTHCPEEYLFTTPTDFVLTYDVYTILDTTFDVSPVEASLSINVDSAMDSYTSGSPCSCELSLWGNVNYSGTFADSVMVFLYQVNPNGTYIKRDSVETDVAGYFQFLYLPEGNYIAKAIPSAVKYPNYLPTYFNNLTGATQWDSALVIMTQCGFIPLPVNIDLITKLPQTGGWQCNGYVLEYYGYNSGAKMAPGEPIPDIDITIDQSPGGSISSTTTDANGYFAFTGLNNNATFIVRADIPGLPNDSIYTFTVTPGDPALDSLNFYVDTVGVYILPEYIFTSINVIQSKNVNVNIAPNPTNSNFILEINAEKNTTMKINMSNCMGQLIFSENSSLTTGYNKIQFDIKDYPAGIYYMSISNENDYFIKKIVKQ